MIPPCASQAAAPAEVRGAIDEILSSPEFRPQRGLLEVVIEKIGEWLEDILPGGLRGGSEVAAVLARALVWGVLTAIVVLLAVALARSLARRARAEPGTEPSSPNAQRRERFQQLRSQARAAASRSDWLLALRLEFTALVVGLGERGDLEYRDAYTNRELVERGHPGPAALAVLQPLVPELDRKSFGGEAAGPDDVARLSALCDRLAPADR